MALAAKEHVSFSSNPDQDQRHAADPQTSVWVAASAGSGKTKVLTDRVLRLLLPGDDGRPGTLPHRILCLTFTKTAASEMALRLNKRLSEWASWNDEKLAADLKNLLGRVASPEECAAARRLFAAVVDAPGGLKIMTLHSFCQSVLGRFPLEAGLPPQFTALDERQAGALLARARDDVLAAARQEPGSAIGCAIATLAAATGEENFSGLLADVVRERHQLDRILSETGGTEGLYAALCRTLKISENATADDVLRDACADGAFDEAVLRRCCRVLAEHGTEKTEIPRSMAIQAWLDSPPEKRIEKFSAYKSEFLTDKGVPRKNLATKKVADTDPDVETILRTEADRLAALDDHIRAATCAALTRDLILTGQAVRSRYAQLKESRAGLDFDDLIYRTLDLLGKDSMAGWVMYKLDGGLDHVLIDEAQDTNPEQWDIVRALCDDFFSGQSTRGDTVRTIFSVGDEKQSIYSFQRAAPDKFRAMRSWFADRVQQAGREWRSIPMDTSFRSSPSVLRFVDEVFAPPAVRRGLGLDVIRHESHRREDAGLVELWPVFATKDKEERDPWQLPDKPLTSRSGASRLAEHISDTIKNWCDHNEAQPGDIMVLVRRRSAFVNQLIRALKLRGVPVGGLDRMVLKEQLAVQDLAAAAQFALLPEDDLSLACLLKSPLIGWDDQKLEDAAARRGGTLWAAIKNEDDRDWLESLIAQARTDRPYEFFSRLLQTPCPADNTSGLRAMTARLGEEAIDPLEEFLNAALDHEDNAPPSLQNFLKEFDHGESEIKREQESAGGTVRIMTVHGAKGLQAPIVILPDTVRASRTPPNGAHRLVWPDKSGLSVPLWSPRGDLDCSLYDSVLGALVDRQDEEYRRLLYVAMTRAGDRLYIGGYTGTKKAADGHWHDLMKQGMERLDDREEISFSSPWLEGDEKILRISNPQIRAVKKEKEESGAVLPAALPWLFAAPAPEPDPPRPLIPSRPAESDDDLPVSSPLADGGDAHRFRRGLVTHKLLQFLPDLPPETRRNAAHDFTARHAADLPDAVRAGIVSEIMAILENPDWASLFGPGSLAEVPLTGLAQGRLVSGQIDRLLVQENEILIVDYKTNRPPPQDAKDIPAAYRHQMKAYSDIVAAIYEGRKIRCFLLWTDGPGLMELT